MMDRKDCSRICYHWNTVLYDILSRRKIISLTWRTNHSLIISKISIFRNISICYYLNVVILRYHDPVWPRDLYKGPGCWHFIMTWWELCTKWWSLLWEYSLGNMHSNNRILFICVFDHRTIRQNFRTLSLHVHLWHSWNIAKRDFTRQVTEPNH